MSKSKKPLTEKQCKVQALGKLGEKRAKEWLEGKGFTVTNYNPKAHSGYYDIKAEKNGEKWIIEVKTGENPSLNIPNFLKMINEKGYHKVGLALVTENDVYLLEIKKTRIAAFKAWKTRKGVQLCGLNGEGRSLLGFTSMFCSSLNTNPHSLQQYSPVSFVYCDSMNPFPFSRH